MKWINIHIPKCAGTTFTSILKANFNLGFGDGRSYLSDRRFKYSSDQVYEILTCFQKLQCFSDHKLSIQLPWNEVPLRAITFVREPASRFLSHYSYCRMQAAHGNIFDKEAAALSLDDYITETLENTPKKDLGNGQCYHFFGDNSSYDFSKVESLLAKQRLLLFPVESFEDVCIYLESCYSEVFKDTSHVLLNASNKQSVTAEQLYRIRAHMDYDTKLYELAKEWFENALSTHFSSSHELKSRRRDLAKRNQFLSLSLTSPSRRLQKIMTQKIRLCGRVGKT
jgi:hypothetical protein